jgi:molybdate transport system substrate-binding protein
MKRLIAGGAQPADVRIVARGPGGDLVEGAMRRACARLLTGLLLLLTQAMAAGAAIGAEIRILGANAVREPVLALAAAFEKTTGHRITAAWSGTAGIVKRIDDGEVVDLVVVGADSVDRLIRDGRLRSGSRVDFARTGVGVAVRAGAARPDISSEDAVRQAVLGAKSVAYSSGPSGVYVARLFERMGIADQVKGKLVLPPPNVLVGDVVARGDADLGFQQMSDLTHVRGIDLLGPLPPSIQSYTTYSIAVHALAPAPEAAEALVRFLVSPAARDAVARAGLDPM